MTDSGLHILEAIRSLGFLPSPQGNSEQFERDHRDINFPKPLFYPSPIKPETRTATVPSFQERPLTPDGRFVAVARHAEKLKRKFKPGPRNDHEGFSKQDVKFHTHGFRT